MTTETQELRTTSVPAKDGAAARTPKGDNAPRPERVSLKAALGLALTSSVLLWLCYFPVACGWLAWVALVPMLSLVRAEGRRRVYVSVWVSALVFYIAAIQWMRVADDRMYFTWIGLSIHCSLFTVLGFFLLRILDRRTRWPLVVTVPVVWTAVEYFRGHFLGGFPWYFLSHSQHDYLYLTQIADLGGAYGVTVLIAACNGLLVAWLCRVGWYRRLLALPGLPESTRPIALFAQSLAVLLLLGGALAYGAYRLQDDNFAEGPRIALIQSNLDQRLRNLNTPDAGKIIVEHNRDLSDTASLQRPRPALIVWPETSYPDDWNEADVPVEQLSADGRTKCDHAKELAHLVARRWSTNVLLGMNAEVHGMDGQHRRYNSAVLVQSDAGRGGRYDKIHRVPFGEFVPFREWLPWMNEFAPYDYDYSVAAGEHFTRFSLGQYRFGVVICYEDTDPSLARQYVRADADGPPVDFLINISNDGWFDGTSEHEQHLAICRFRAIECRRAVARAVNMGISGVVDSNGRVLAPTKLNAGLGGEWPVYSSDGRGPALPVAEWGRYKKVPGVFLATIPIDQRGSLYARLGDWLPGLSWAIIGVGLILAVIRPRKE
ncbi:MAG: apolipoprotein N-acyltransferase [Gemmataceae bacterium]|nr:apolipoprotein N-acyltransferase [Gemmataceae bacterium]